MSSQTETIFVIDDDITNLAVARNNLVDRYNVFTAPSGKKLFQLLERVKPTLILLDIEMPDMDGYDVITLLKDSEETAKIPVIFLSARNDPESEVKGLQLGAVDYIIKPFSKELLNRRIELHILFENQKKELLRYSQIFESELTGKSKMIFELQDSILKTVAELIECRGNEIGGHIERTQRYLSLLVEFLFEHGVYAHEMSDWDVDLFVMSSQLHDIGKITIKDSIMLKPSKLISEEFEEVKKHTLIGAGIIRRIGHNTVENAFLKHAIILAETHHEKWDGSGYPYGLKGHEIPLQGRLMAVVDVYDALRNERPYGRIHTHSEAAEVIRNGTGTHFDPVLNEVFFKHEKEFENAKTKELAPKDTMLQLDSTVKMVANIMDVRSGNTGKNFDSARQRLKIFVDFLIKHERFGVEISKWNLDLFLLSAQLHDVGKLAVEDGILNKESELTEDEFHLIKNHTEFGINIVRQIRENVDNGSLLQHAEALIGSHHERWDGTGYPLGLRGRGIPLQGRIMALFDVYEALTNDRPHRERKTHKEAVAIIHKSSGTQFDPDLVDAFIKCEDLIGKVSSE